MDTKFNKIFVSDFDGTMTQNDFYDLICQEFQDLDVARFWGEYEAGKITHFEALKNIFSSIRAPESHIRQIIKKMELDPDLKQSIDRLHQAGWQVVVASAGCAWYIEILLGEAGIDIPVYANPGTFDESKGLVMELPKDPLFMCPEIGVNKRGVVKSALKDVDVVAFAGDGNPDMAAALAVSPQYRFARKWLAKRLDEVGESYHTFGRWRDVADKLLKGN